MMMSILRYLQHTRYAQTDHKVLRYRPGTYIGKVLSGGVFVGLISVVYLEDCVPSKDDVKLLGIIDSAIGVEEKRKQAETALKYRVRIQDTRYTMQDTG